MKKTLLLACAALTLALSAHAIRADHRLFPVKQSDGTTVMLYKNGDGHVAFYTTADHQVVVRNDNGTLCYGQLVGGQLVATDIVCHNIDNRTAEETAFLASNPLKPTDDALTPLLASRHQPKRVQRVGASTSDGLGAYGQNSGGAMPSIGSHTIPVILVAFSDVAFSETTTVEKMTRYFNAEGYNEDNPSKQKGSVKDYFMEQSRGKFVPTFDVVAQVTLSHPVAYYGKNDKVSDSDNVYNVINMVRDAVAAAVNQGVDFSKYKEGSSVPNLTIMFAGYGEATGGDDDTIWPHEMDLKDFSLPMYNTFSGTKFDSYFVGNELYGYEGYDYPMGMGVFAHEFSHALGLPDFYDPKYSYSGDDAFSYWSLMDSGSYVDDAYAPVGYNAYERSYMGWLEIPELTDAQAVTLTNCNDSEGQMAVMLRHPSHNYEYFIFENRQAGTWYPSSFGTGLMVTRYAYNANAWVTNTTNPSADSKRAKLVNASGRKMTSGTAQPTDLFGNGTNSLEELTWYSGTTTTDDGIYRIIQQPDGTVTFNYKDKTLQGGTAVVGNEVYEKVTDAATLAAGDTIMLVNEGDAVAMGNDQQSNSRSVVSVSVAGGKAYGNNGVMKLAVLKTASGGFGFYSADKKAYLSSAASGIKLVSKSDKNCIADITITDGNAVITFQGSNKRKNIGYNGDNVQFTCYADAQDNVQIYRKTAGGTDGISTIQEKTKEQDCRVYTLGGQLVGTSLDGLPKGIYVKQGKKYVVK